MNDGAQKPDSGRPVLVKKEEGAHDAIVELVWGDHGLSEKTLREGLRSTTVETKKQKEIQSPRGKRRENKMRGKGPGALVPDGRSCGLFYMAGSERWLRAPQGSPGR